MSNQLPDSFYTWAYRGRADMVRRLRGGEEVSPEQAFLNFTRHCPTLITQGPAGLNGAIKGVGFVPRREFLDEVIDAYSSHIQSGWHRDYQQEGLSLLYRHIWSESAAQRIDFSRVVTLEMARGHTWLNLQENPGVTLVYFQPPRVSFEVRGQAEIHTQGPYHTFTNAQHDVYHRPDSDRWKQRPAYVISVEEIFDNSATSEGFGSRLL